MAYSVEEGSQRRVTDFAERRASDRASPHGGGRGRSDQPDDERDGHGDPALAGNGPTARSAMTTQSYASAKRVSANA
jgi:hypothetical protein